MKRRKLTMADVHRIFFEPPAAAVAPETDVDLGIIVLVIGAVLSMIGILTLRGWL